MIVLSIAAGAFLAACAWFSVINLPAARRMTLADRIAPFISGSSPSVLVTGPWRPLTLAAADAIDRLLGGTRSVRRRLQALGSTMSVESFRVEQVLWGIWGALTGVGATVLAGVVRQSVNLTAALAMVAVGILTGVLARDWWLGVRVRRRQTAMLAEFPVVAELLALAVTAGEPPLAALDRVCRACRGELSAELATALAQARVDANLPVALQALAERTSLGVLTRFADGVVIAMERGTPLADVLRAQANDVREASKRELLASGGKREVAMMMPVVFLILPITVVFALYPGLVNISLLTR
ncbi:MAG: pilus assembly protein TadB [Corynebacteriales bacterium]|nr:pilus assembly protein TadB [Mycobacteriales bacterium]